MTSPGLVLSGHVRGGRVLSWLQAHDRRSKLRAAFQQRLRIYDAGRGSCVPFVRTVFKCFRFKARFWRRPCCVSASIILLLPSLHSWYFLPSLLLIRKMLKIHFRLINNKADHM